MRVRTEYLYLEAGVEGGDLSGEKNKEHGKKKGKNRKKKRKKRGLARRPVGSLIGFCSSGACRRAQCYWSTSLPNRGTVASEPRGGQGIPATPHNMASGRTWLVGASARPAIF